MYIYEKNRFNNSNTSKQSYADAYKITDTEHSDYKSKWKK